MGRLEQRCIFPFPPTFLVSMMFSILKMKINYLKNSSYLLKMSPSTPTALLGQVRNYTLPSLPLLVRISSSLTASFIHFQTFGERRGTDDDDSCIFCKWQLKLVVLKVTPQKISLVGLLTTFQFQNLGMYKFTKKNHSPLYPKENGADRLMGPCFGYRRSALCNIECLSGFFCVSSTFWHLIMWLSTLRISKSKVCLHVCELYGTIS